MSQLEDGGEENQDGGLFGKKKDKVEKEKKIKAIKVLLREKFG